MIVVTKKYSNNRISVIKNPLCLNVILDWEDAKPPVFEVCPNDIFIDEHWLNLLSHKDKDYENLLVNILSDHYEIDFERDIINFRIKAVPIKKYAQSYRNISENNLSQAVFFMEKVKTIIAKQFPNRFVFIQVVISNLYPLKVDSNLESIRANFAYENYKRIMGEFSTSKSAFVVVCDSLD